MAAEDCTAWYFDRFDIPLSRLTYTKLFTLHVVGRPHILGISKHALMLGWPKDVLSVLWMTMVRNGYTNNGTFILLLGRIGRCHFQKQRSLRLRSVKSEKECYFRLETPARCYSNMDRSMLPAPTILRPVSLLSLLLVVRTAENACVLHGFQRHNHGICGILQTWGGDFSREVTGDPCFWNIHRY